MSIVNKSRRLSHAEAVELWQRGVAGDTAARNSLLETVFPLIRSTAARFVEPRHQWAGLQTDDFFQAGVLHLIERFHCWQPDRGKLGTWVVMELRGAMQAVSRQVCRDRLTMKEDGDRAAASRALDRSPLNPDDPAELLAARDEWRNLRRAIRGLPARQGAIVRQFFDDGLTTVEIADGLGVSRSRVGQLLVDAITRLRCSQFGGAPGRPSLWQRSCKTRREVRNKRRRLAKKAAGPFISIAPLV